MERKPQTHSHIVKMKRSIKRKKVPNRKNTTKPPALPGEDPEISTL